MMKHFILDNLSISCLIPGLDVLVQNPVMKATFPN